MHMPSIKSTHKQHPFGDAATVVFLCLWLGLAPAVEGLASVSQKQGGRPDEAAIFNNGRWVKAGGEYTWQLDEGNMDIFDVDQFCKDLPGDVLFVGDSMTRSHYESFVTYALRGKVKRVYGIPGWYKCRVPTEGGFYGMVRESIGCNGTRRFVYIRNDVLATHAPDVHMGRNIPAPLVPFPATRIREYPWELPEILRRFSVFVLNVGVKKLPDDLYRKTVEGVVNVFDRHPEVDKRYVFFRTTTPGVKGCENMEGKPPFQSLEEAEDYYTEHPWYGKFKFFKAHNDVAKSLFEEHGLAVCDVWKPTLMNGHAGHLLPPTDCLHYISTSVVFTHWNRVFYNLIRRRAAH